VAALTHCEAQIKRVHAKTKDAVNGQFTTWHGICSGTLKMKGRTLHSNMAAYLQRCACLCVSTAFAIYARPLVGTRRHESSFEHIDALFS
jgi:hypothetical protein